MKYIKVVYARVLYFINNDNDVFDNDFQMPQLNAPVLFQFVIKIFTMIEINEDAIFEK